MSDESDRRHSLAAVAGRPRTLYDMIWDDHLVDEQPDGTCLLYIDRHIVHEVDSPQAFAGLRLAGIKVRAPDKTLLVVDHNVPTSDRAKTNPDPESAAQIAYLAENAKLFGLEYYDEFDKRQGICHVNTSNAVPRLPRARPGTTPCATGRRCAATTARISTAKSGSTRQGFLRPSRASALGDRRREQAPRSPRSTIWASRAARRSPTSRSTACSSVRAPIRASRTCARSRAWRTAGRSIPTSLR